MKHYLLIKNVYDMRLFHSREAVVSYLRDTYSVFLPKDVTSCELFADFLKQFHVIEYEGTVGKDIDITTLFETSPNPA